MENYKEKYEKAFERAKNYHEGHTLDVNPKSAMEYVFPELKESEDERIRKALICGIKSVCKDEEIFTGGFTRRQIVSWLEKQGEQKPADKLEPKFKVGDKIKLAEEPKYPAREIIAIKNDAYCFDKLEQLPFINQDKWELVEQTPADKIEQKPAWSEEDERMCKNLLFLMEQENSISSWEGCYEWLKSIKERMKGECISVTDEELAQAKKDAYNDALDKIEYHSGEPTFDDGWSAAIRYLKKKNTQPQNTWKPSEEQMEALRKAVDEHFDIDGDDLWHLYEDLKKLRKE